MSQRNSSSPPNIIPAIDIIGDTRCTGCAACIDPCPESALEMMLNLEGFYRPDVDRDKCTGCSACVDACPVIALDKGIKLNETTWTEPKAYGAWSTNEQTRLASSSGGAFTELARAMFQRGGIVVGCAWTEDWTPKHVVAHTEEELIPMRGAKYVPSNVEDGLRKAIEASKSGVPVLFTGTPCQVAAIENLAKFSRSEDLITCETVCGGIGSLKVFHKYLQWLFNGQPITHYTFRDKSLGWQTIYAQSSDQQIHQVRLASDPFSRMTMSYHLTEMEACLDCQFQNMHRKADISLADFWGAPKELHDPRGLSLVLISSPRGAQLFQEATQMNWLKQQSIELERAIRKNPRARGRAWKTPRLRKQFMHDVARGRSFRYLYRIYFIPLRFWDRIRYRLKTIKKSIKKVIGV